MSVGAEKEGVGRAVGLGGGSGCQATEEDPLPDCGACAPGQGGRRWRLPQPAWVEGSSARLWEQATGTGWMDLEASLLPTGPNASNTSDGPDNLTSAGDPPFSGLWVENGKVSPLRSPPRTRSISYINIIMPSVFGTICLLGIIGNSTVIFAVVKKSKLHWCSNVPDIFIINLSFFLAFALPFVVITAAYVRILQRMTSSVAPASQRSIRLRTKRVTRTAIAICLVFFVCWAPYYVLQLTQLSISRPTLTFVYLYNAAISLGYANSCLNPFVYIVLCETFRKRLVLSVKPAAQGQLRAVSNAQTADEERTESKGT
uniref:Melanin-concentrating hormone receptor 1 n=1 Tax=Nomascus leucogenys TaxID=61853 RepID=A0A2I3GWZ2_NOMLE